MAEPPFLMRLAAHVAEVSESEDISGGQGHQVCFRSSEPSGVFSEFRITGSVFGVQGYQEGKCAVVPRKLRRVGHQQEKCMQIPQKAVK